MSTLLGRKRRIGTSLMLTALCGVLGLGGCGWRLQGSARIPEAAGVVAIDALETHSDFYRELRAQLLAAGARWPTKDSPAQAVVTVKGEMAGQRVSSVSARNTPEQYEVFYNIEYVVQVADDRTETERFELTTNYSYDSTKVLAKEREQQQIQRALARELAGRVVRQLISLGRAHELAASG